MNRSNLAGLAVIAVLGLAVGLWQAGGTREVPRMVGASEAAATWPRQEFPLLPADLDADREAPALAVDDRGRVLLAFASETGPGVRTIYLARAKSRGAFDAATPWRKVPIRAAAATKADPPNPSATDPADVLPRLTASGPHVSIGWVEASDGGPGAVFYVARSIDGGRSFSEPSPVHGPGASSPGSTAIVAGPSGGLDAAWLDGRDGGGGREPFASARREGSDGFEAEELVVPGPAGKGAYPCSDLALARPEGGPLFVAFRHDDGDRSDIRVARGRGDGRPGFDPPVSVGDRRRSSWSCPREGPSLAMAGGRLVVAWMDDHSGTSRVYIADSDPATLSFREPTEIAPESKGSQGHPKLVADGRGGVIAAWDESPDPAAPADTAPGHPAPTGSGRVIWFAASADGRTFAPSRPVDPRPGATQLAPTIVLLPVGEALVAWNERTEEGKRIVVARVRP